MKRFVLGCVSLAGLAMSACTPVTSLGGGANSVLDDYKEFQTVNAVNFAPNSAVSAITGSADYIGVAQLTKNDFSESFLGVMNTTVDFDTEDLSGTINGFQELQLGTVLSVGAEVPGSLNVSGALGTNNESLRGGISGTADGSVDGQDVSLTFSGNLLGSSGDTMLVYFSGAFAGQAWGLSE